MWKIMQIQPVVAIVAALLLGATMDSVAAEAYPARAVKVLVGGAPASVPDTMIRPIAEHLSIAMGQPVVIENRPGAGGIVAMEVLAHSAPDGYTVALATMSQAIFNAYLFSKLPYDPQRDLEPVGALVTGAMVLAANPSYPANSLADLVKVAKADGAKPFVAMPQTGSPPHVVALLLQRALGVDFTMVPYKAGVEAVAAAVSGDVSLVIDAPTVVAQQVSAGKLKALVVTGREREAALPSTPTVAQSGFGNIQGEAWIGLVAPAGTPQAVIAILNRHVQAVLALPEIRERMAFLGFRPLVSTPESFARMMADERIKWSTVIRDANLRLD